MAALHYDETRRRRARTPMNRQTLGVIRHDWSLDEIEAIYTAPLIDLITSAQQVHRDHHPPNQVQACVLLSVKTGGCPEDRRERPPAAPHPALPQHRCSPSKTRLPRPSGRESKARRDSAWGRHGGTPPPAGSSNRS